MVRLVLVAIPFVSSIICEGTTTVMVGLDGRIGSYLRDGSFGWEGDVGRGQGDL